MRLLILLALFCAGTRSAEPPVAPALELVCERLKVPGVRIPKLNELFSLDRLPDFSKWSKPLPFGLLSGVDGEKLPQSTGYLVTDGERLYCAIRNVAPIAGLPDKALPLDADVWSSDNVEFMLLPHFDDRRDYFQFAIDPAGNLFDAKGPDNTWNSGAEVKVFRDESSWTAVLGVKFSSLGLAAGTLPPFLRLNLHSCRVKRGEQRESDLAWSPTFSRSNHVPSRFGIAEVPAAAQHDTASVEILKWAEEKQGLHVLLSQNFDRDVAPFAKAKIQKEGGRSWLISNGPSTTLERNFGDIAGLKMAFAYRTPADVHGLTVQGAGTIARATRPGMSEVYGHGLKVAQVTCNDADGQTRALDLGRDAFKFRRPYGH